MEKRLKRVQNWIDRCMEACRCKAWTSAIAELECARAELDSAGREIWEAATEEEARSPHRGLRTSKALLLHVIPVTMMILLLAVGPTSIESFNPSGTLSFETGPSVEWITADERILLDNLRKSLSEGRSATVAASGQEKASTGTPSTRRTKGLSPAEAVESARGPIPPFSSQGGVSVATEDLLSLIQVGQRALRPDGEALHVERP